MKTIFAAILGLVDLLCVCLIYYRLFTSHSPGNVILSILLPTAIAFAAAFLIGRLAPENPRENDIRSASPTLRHRDA